MDRSERLKICQICQNRKFDVQTGILCSLTGEKPAFENECEHYMADDAAIRKTIDEEKRKKELAEAYDGEGVFEGISNEGDAGAMVKKSANWFYWIAGLSLINSIAIYSGADFAFVVGLGITQLIDGVVFALIGEASFWGLIPNLLIIGIFVLLGIYANRLSKVAFISGLIIYTLDALIFLMVPDFLSIGFHVFALIMIFRGFRYIEEARKLSAPILAEN